jgi:spermidine synthase
MSTQPTHLAGDAYVQATGMDDLWNVWYSELNNGVAGLTLKVDRIIESTESPFQRIDVLDTKQYGKILVLYGSLMAAEKDNNAYNEMITHVPLFAHPNPKKVLIIGGGDCGALTEVLKHPEVEQCTMCEIDKMVVDVSKRHFPELTKGLSDSRARVIYDDGKAFIENSNEKFDVVILDLSDPIGPAVELFQKSFYETVFSKLNDDGIMVPQTESPYFHEDSTRAVHQSLKTIFPIVKAYTAFMPIYPSAYWSFAFCSKKYDPLKSFDESRWTKLGLSTKYYNAEVHRGAFALPQWVKKITG